MGVRTRKYAGRAEGTTYTAIVLARTITRGSLEFKTDASS